MSKRNPTPLRSLRLLPRAEGLETRQLLTSPGITLPIASVSGKPTAQVSGTDPDGAHWTLKLYGPGSLNVVDQNGAAFTKKTANTPDSIDTITVGGAITTQTRLVGTVTPAPDGDSNVYFQNLQVTPTGELGRIDSGQVNNFKQQQLGIAAIDMPDFYLAHTETTNPNTPSPIHSSADLAGGINIPGGVLTLRFGGVDATYTAPGGTPLNQTGQSNEFAIDLGLPIVVGTSVIVNSVTTTAEANSTAGDPPYQDMVTFLVNGRLNLFQANDINGVTTSGLTPSQFGGSSVTSSDLSPGGTYVISGGGSFGTGQIGNVRVGGNATNLTTIAEEYGITTTPAEGALDAKVSNFFIGGETNNVILMAPSGVRNASFGLGMDNTIIDALTVHSLRVNRDVTNSNVVAERSIENLFIGGNMEDSNINAGYEMSLFAESIYPPTTLLAAGSGVFFGTPPPTIINRITSPDTALIEPLAENGGSITGRIAGSIINSVLSASVDPNPSGLEASAIDNSGVFEPKNSNTIFPFGSPDDLTLPRGVINIKFEGTIDNSTSPLTATATSAFFARQVHVKKGPVIPPSVPSQPYVAPTKYDRGQESLQGTFKVDHIPSNLKILRRAQLAAEKHSKKT